MVARKPTPKAKAKTKKPTPKPKAPAPKGELTPKLTKTQAAAQEMVRRAAEKVLGKKIPKPAPKAKPVAKTNTKTEEAKARLGKMLKKNVVEPQVTRDKSPGREPWDAPEKARAGSGGPSGSATARHGIVRARAGTGKTFTMVLSIAYIFRDMIIPGVRTNFGGTVRNITLWELVVRKLGFDPEPSPEQKAVWDFIAAPYGKVGATGSELAPRSIRYLAFNSSIVEDFSNDYKWLTEALRSVGIDFSFSTVHSMAFAACRRAYDLKGWGSIDKYKVQNLLSGLWEVDLREVWREKGETIQAVEQLVSLCKLTLLADPSDVALQDLADHYSIVLNGDREKVFQDVRALLELCAATEKGQQIDYNDQIWLPVVNKLKVDRFQLVLGDEAQDWNRCQQEVILQAGERIIVVGDDRQAIYGFAGADTDSLDRMQYLLANMRKVNGVESGDVIPTFPLTETRRCGKAIVAAVNHIVPDFRAHPSNGEGMVARIANGSFGGKVGEQDMVLCRINAPLVGYAFKLIREGRRANIVGRDIGQGLKTLIKKSKCEDVSEFLVWLDNYYQLEAARLSKRRNPDSEAMVTLQDKVECLRSFSEGAITIKELYTNIDKVFRGKICPGCKKSFDEKQRECWTCKRALVKPDGTQFSSIHRAKGMESNRVFLLRPDLLPHPKAVTPFAKGQEANLEYVAKTRAKKELYIVNLPMRGEEDDCGYDPDYNPETE